MAPSRGGQGPGFGSVLALALLALLALPAGGMQPELPPGVSSWTASPAEALAAGWAGTARGFPAAALHGGADASSGTNIDASSSGSSAAGRTLAQLQPPQQLGRWEAPGTACDAATAWTCLPRVDPWNNGSSVALCCPKRSGGLSTGCATFTNTGFPRCRLCGVQCPAPNCYEGWTCVSDDYGCFVECQVR